MTKLPVAFVALILASTLAIAQSTLGASDCGEWIKSPGSERKAWLLGYLSGLNIQHTFDKKIPADPLAKLNSRDQAFLWVDNYCRGNPLGSVLTAGTLLFAELKRL